MIGDTGEEANIQAKFDIFIIDQNRGPLIQEMQVINQKILVITKNVSYKLQNLLFIDKKNAINCSKNSTKFGIYR